MRVRRAVALAFALLPASAFAVQTIDDIRWPDSGAYPAYPEASAATGRFWHLFVDGGEYRDNNIFRLPSTVARQSDHFERLGVGLRADLPFSRQRLQLEARADNNNFHNFDILDNTSTRASARWAWEAGNTLSGDVGGLTNKALASFGQIQAALKDMVTENRLYGSAGLRITPDWRIRAGADTFEYKHSAAALQGSDVEGSNVTAGIDYVTGLQNSIGAQVRYGQGNFPHLIVGVTPVNGHYKEVEPSLVVHYNLGGKSSVDGRLGYTKRTHEQLSNRDYKGSTGDVIFHWSPTPKTLLDVRAYRETRPFVTNTVSTSSFSVAQSGSPAALLPQAGLSPGSNGAVQTTVETTTSYVLARGLAIAPYWAITEQIIAQLVLFSENASYRGDPAITLAGAPQREEKFTGYTLGGGWSPLRRLMLSLSFEHGKRTSNVVGRAFDYEVLSANARYQFF